MLSDGLVTGQKFLLKPADIITSFNYGVSLHQPRMQRQCRWDWFDDKLLYSALQARKAMRTVITMNHELCN